MSWKEQLPGALVLVVSVAVDMLLVLMASANSETRYNVAFRNAVIFLRVLTARGSEWMVTLNNTQSLVN